MLEISLDKSLKPELTSRVLAIDIVSWKWNKSGLWYHARTGKWTKLLNRTERGVIAQTVKEQLGTMVPGITVQDGKILKVNYGLLAAAALDAAEYLDAQYRKKCKKADRTLDLAELIQKHVPPEPQAGAVALLAITKLYQRELEA